MKTIIDILTAKLNDAFKTNNYEGPFGTVNISSRPDLCQFQCNGSFAAAKIYKKAPFVIAEEVVSTLVNDAIFKNIQVEKPGFININISDDYLIAILKEVTSDPHMGITQITDETIVIDYGGANVAKPLHIGHLRTAIIGESLKRIARSTGRTAVGDVHLGDWGLPMGLVIAEMTERYPDWKCFSESFDPNVDKIATLDVNTLNEIYPFASKKSSQNEDFKLKAQNITAKLQNHHPGYYALWQEIIKISKIDMKKSYDRLNVEFDYWYGEYDSEDYIPELIEVLNDNNLLYESNGAMVVDVKEDNDKVDIPPIIIKKSNNANVYATTDLATIIQREKYFHPNGIWYVVDSRQSLHFNQVFRCAKKAGLVPQTTKLIHAANGTINGSDGKPYKTREGGIMQLSTFIDIIIETISKNPNNEINCDNDINKKLAIAAIKFGDLINHRSKDYIFDIDKFTSPEGKTGVYILYMLARMNSIIKKLDEEKVNNAMLYNIYSDTERDIILNVIQLNDVFTKSFNEQAPNYICENLYQLSVLFSKFYHDNHIIKEADIQKQLSWIKLILIIREAILKQLYALGIEAVEAM